MYDELIKRLRNCATEAAPCKTCDMTDDGSCSDTLMKQAADAIEELQKRVPKTPHGRLIDADALDRAFTDLRFNSDGTLNHWGDRPGWCMHGYEVEKLIADAPTIFPAEGGGNRWLTD